MTERDVFRIGARKTVSVAATDLKETGPENLVERLHQQTKQRGLAPDLMERMTTTTQQALDHPDDTRLVRGMRHHVLAKLKALPTCSGSGTIPGVRRLPHEAPYLHGD
ncbi:hypothetical protein K1W69_13855 [Hoeflea sp. WL0058]|uniref:Uncharacterized protein n=1 Tax=Flavimaribacter sediminis TaxID=2865987 RepID=A0AAE2ZL91_9HYPH|nr:hypothetical protein [Flavimaribacter sediminis]MBW8638276.1 hypothetical protein [Flavimaribacter sediminis]